MCFFEQLAIDDEVVKNFSYFCCIDKGALNLRFRLPSSGYVPGQMINTTVDYVNASDGIRVTEIRAKLEQVRQMILVELIASKIQYIPRLVFFFQST